MRLVLQEGNLIEKPILQVMASKRGRARSDMIFMVSSSALLSGLLIKCIDHLGLVAGICKELKIAETIDNIIPKSQDCQVNHGQALVAMILNGLGFHSRTLHLFPDFFKQKPTECLIGNGVKPEDLNDDLIGSALDAFYQEGVSALCQHLSAKVIEHLKLKSDAIHIDITSFRNFSISSVRNKNNNLSCL